MRGLLLLDCGRKTTVASTVVSLTTIKSYWVPFEVGYGYSQQKLISLKAQAFLTLPTLGMSTDYATKLSKVFYGGRGELTEA
jgi:hypothetical protein